MTETPKSSAEVAVTENVDTASELGATVQEPGGASVESKGQTIAVGQASRGTPQEAQSSNPKGSATRARRSGGPRSRLGKARSRCNALKHGLCSKEILLADEDPAEFNALLRGYRKYWRPVGMPEEVAVKDLVEQDWCLGRVFPAERAEIELERRYNSRAADRQRRDREEAEAIEAAIDAQTSVDAQTAQNLKGSVEIPRPGLMDRWDNPVIRRKFLQLLKSFKKSIQLRGFFPDRDHQIIDKLVGVRTPSEFRLTYCFYAEHEREPFKVVDLPFEERLAKFVTYLQEEIDNFEGRAKRMDDASAKRERLESKSAIVPEAHRLDRLLRYRANLQRVRDRKLNELIRMQQIRKGKAVPQN